MKDKEEAAQSPRPSLCPFGQSSAHGSSAGPLQRGLARVLWVDSPHTLHPLLAEGLLANSFVSQASSSTAVRHSQEAEALQTVVTIAAASAHLSCLCMCHFTSVKQHPAGSEGLSSQALSHSVSGDWGRNPAVWLQCPAQPPHSSVASLIF